jgi:hypothetical protein
MSYEYMAAAFGIWVFFASAIVYAYLSILIRMMYESIVVYAMDERMTTMTDGAPLRCLQTIPCVPSLATVELSRQPEAK